MYLHKHLVLTRSAAPSSIMISKQTALHITQNRGLSKIMQCTNTLHKTKQVKNLTRSDETPAPVTSISSVPKAAQAGSPKDIYRGRSLQGLSGPSLQKSPAIQHQKVK